MNERLEFKSMYQLDGMLFSSIINTGFILFLGKLLLSVVLQSFGNPSMMLVAQLGLIIICNALPEVLYLGRAEGGVPALADAAQFTRENWIEWFAPFLVLVLPWLLVSPEFLLVLMAKMDELIPATIVFQSVRLFSSSFLPGGFISTIVSYGLGLTIFVWFMLFRGFLFQELQRGSRRTRIFLSKQR